MTQFPHHIGPSGHDGGPCVQHPSLCPVPVSPPLSRRDPSAAVSFGHGPEGPQLPLIPGLPAPPRPGGFIPPGSGSEGSLVGLRPSGGQSVAAVVQQPWGRLLSVTGRAAADHRGVRVRCSGVERSSLFWSRFCTEGEAERSLSLSPAGCCVPTTLPAPAIPCPPLGWAAGAARARGAAWAQPREASNPPATAGLGPGSCRGPDGLGPGDPPALHSPMALEWAGIWVPGAGASPQLVPQEIPISVK